jgi:hypothetical protein
MTSCKPCDLVCTWESESPRRQWICELESRVVKSISTHACIRDSAARNHTALIDTHRPMLPLMKWQIRPSLGQHIRYRPMAPCAISYMLKARLDQQHAQMRKLGRTELNGQRQARESSACDNHIPGCIQRLHSAALNPPERASIKAVASLRVSSSHAPFGESHKSPPYRSRLC